MKVLVTGATGFVGQALINSLVETDFSVFAVVRQWSQELPQKVEQIEVSDLTTLSDSSLDGVRLKGVDVVIHLAARAHIMCDEVADPLSEFRKINTAGTLELARQAAKEGVRRFVFISSVKVNGELTVLNKPFTPDTPACPKDPYGVSKHEAEQGLLALAEETGLEIVIIRPPLVYGPNVRANFASMMKWVFKGVPLPFGAIYNRRSFIALENLASFIVHCIDHPKAANEIFLISDDEDVSTTELLKKLARAFGKKPLLVRVSVSLMTIFAKLIGKEGVANRLFGSLQVDSTKSRILLDWKPIVTMDEQLKKIADIYVKN